LIHHNYGLQEIDGLGALSQLEELRLEGLIVPTVLSQAATLPMLKRLMLPIGQDAVDLDRPKNLPHVEIRSADPDSRKWWTRGNPTGARGPTESTLEGSPGLGIALARRAT
jgi:hypothetical protein